MDDLRRTLLRRLGDMSRLNGATLAQALEGLLAPGCVWHVAAPVGDLRGPIGIAAGWFQPLCRALPDYMLRELLVLGGASRTGSGAWVATLGHIVANFTAPLFGIPSHNRLIFLRYGAFYRLEGGLIAEAFVLPDLLDLLRQTGWPDLPPPLGSELSFPPPATLDGVCPAAPDQSEASSRLVESMLGDLHAFDPATFDSTGQSGPNGYWHPQMLWYGPAGVGSNHTYAGFQRDHRVPFLKAFPDRRGGNHFARFGDGAYVCSGGWPSMTMTHSGPYLGIPATGRPLTLRVMDFWRVQDGTIRENWVLLDLLHLRAQMGRPLLPTAPP